MYKRLLKPIYDFAFSLLAIIIISPVLLSFTLILLFVNKGRPFFFQERPGKNGMIFKVIKFKTMSDLTDSQGRKLPDIKRITKIGSFMRSFSIDEIPQLLNILSGKMSFVGPRPLLKEYLSLYNSYQSRRHEVRPGLTGWAQVSGRNAISWKEKFDLDVFYVDNMTFCLDLKIIWMTFIKILKRENINYPDSVTIKSFTGNN